MSSQKNSTRSRVGSTLSGLTALLTTLACQGGIGAPAGSQGQSGGVPGQPGSTTSGDGGGSEPGTGQLPDEVGVTKTDACSSAVQSFTSELYGPVFSRCIGCHNEFGLARQVGVGYRLKFHGDANFAEHNVGVLSEYAPRDVEVNGAAMPLLVAKATGQISHVGGQVLTPGSAEALLLASFTDKLRNPPACAEPAEDLAALALASLSMASPIETYARAKFVLTGHVATPEELGQLPDTEEMLNGKLDELLASEDFVLRSQEMFADWLRTDAYSSLVRGDELLGMLRDFSQRSYYLRLCTAEITNNCCDASAELCCASSAADPAACTDVGNTQAIDAIAREPMELVKHVVRRDLPLTELVTADYGFVNPYSAMIYGLSDAQRQSLFDADPANDAAEFKPFVMTPTANNDLRASPSGGYPHAGVLAMPSTLVRYPSSDSNQQRTRGARVILERMLAIPVMKLAEFSTATLPADADLELATQEYPACTVCHAAIDPISAHFRSFGATGQYRPGGEGLGRRFQEEAQTHLPQATFLETPLPETLDVDPVRWLGEQVARHDRFALGVLLPVLADLIGAEILAPPSEVLAEGYKEKYLAFLVQQLEITRLRQEFVGSFGLRLKPLVKSIVLGPFFRANGAAALDEASSQALALAGVGLGTLLTPEQLARKLESATGLTYRSGLEATGADMFRSFDEYRLMFGGTDWDATPERYREPNAMAVRIALRMANEMACLAVPQDFALIDPAARRLLKNSSHTTTPEGGGEAPIRADILRLHALLLNEHLPDGHAELEASYQLWLASYQAAQTDTGSSTGSGRGSFGRSNTSCSATASYTAEAAAYPTSTHQVIEETPVVSAWVGVVSYLLADGRFFLQ